LWTPALTEPSSEAAAKSAPFMIAMQMKYYHYQSNREGKVCECGDAQPVVMID
jgi:hypothetical protein